MNPSLLPKSWAYWSMCFWKAGQSLKNVAPCCHLQCTCPERARCLRERHADLACQDPMAPPSSVTVSGSPAGDGCHQATAAVSAAVEPQAPTASASKESRKKMRTSGPAHPVSAESCAAASCPPEAAPQLTQPHAAPKADVKQAEQPHTAACGIAPAAAGAQVVPQAARKKRKRRGKKRRLVTSEAAGSVAPGGLPAAKPAEPALTCSSLTQAPAGE